MVGNSSDSKNIWSGYGYYDVMSNYSWEHMMSNDRMSFHEAMNLDAGTKHTASGASMRTSAFIDPWEINADNEERWGRRDSWKGNPHVEWKRHLQRRLYMKDKTCRCPRLSYRCNNQCNTLGTAAKTDANWCAVILFIAAFIGMLSVIFR